MPENPPPEDLLVAGCPCHQLPPPSPFTVSSLPHPLHLCPFAIPIFLSLLTPSTSLTRFTFALSPPSLFLSLHFPSSNLSFFLSSFLSLSSSLSLGSLHYLQRLFFSALTSLSPSLYRFLPLKPASPSLLSFSLLPFPRRSFLPPKLSFLPFFRLPFTFSHVHQS